MYISVDKWHTFVSLQTDELSQAGVGMSSFIVPI